MEEISTVVKIPSSMEEFNTSDVERDTGPHHLYLIKTRTRRRIMWKKVCAHGGGSGWKRLGVWEV